MNIDDIINGHANKNGLNEVVVGLAHTVTTKKKAPRALFFGMNRFADKKRVEEYRRDGENNKRDNLQHCVWNAADIVNEVVKDRSLVRFNDVDLADKSRKPEQYRDSDDS